MEWRKHFPYSRPRPHQEEALDLLSQNWDKADVFILNAPTAFGKSAIARTLMNALHSVSYITPSNLLVDQFLDEFPDTPTMSRMDSYHCEKWDRPCPITRTKLLQFCKGVCPCSRDLVAAKYRRGPGVYNYHTYLAQKIYRDVLVVDEAHNLLPVIRDRLAQKMWQHDYKYPYNMYSMEQIRKWVMSLPDSKQRTKKVTALREAVTYEVPEYMVQRTTDQFNGKGTARGEPEDRDLLKLLPVDITGSPPLFWPREVRKIVLLSATINKVDVEQLGLGRRVMYINCKSPIPPGSRPIIAEPVVSVNRGNMEQAARELAEYIQWLATTQHPSEKGIIHATYQMAELLRPYLIGDGRYLFHDRGNKASRYQEYRDAPNGSGMVLIASGMYEGIDLPEDLGRWQVISKVPWGSLGDPATAHLARLDPEWYTWETAKVLIQACGRICRTPEDYGVTYIPDASLGRLLRDGKHLLPEWWLEALHMIS